MLTMSEIRSKYPEYEDLSDYELSDKLYNKYYSDLPKAEFFESIKSSPKKDQTLMESLERIGKNALAGYSQFGHNVVNLPHNLTNLISSDISKYVPKQQEYDYAELLGQKENEMQDILVQKLFEYAPSLLIGRGKLGPVSTGLNSVPKVGKYVAPGAELAAPQAAYSYAMELGDNPENAAQSALTTGAITAPFGILGEMARVGSPALKSAAKGGAAIGGAGLGYLATEELGVPDIAQIPASLLSGYLTERGISPKSYASKKVFEGIDPETSKEVVQAAERLGLSYVTPAEAMGDAFSGQRQASLGRTPKGSSLKYERGLERLASEEKAINRFFDDLYDESLDPIKEEFYRNALSTKVPEEFKKQMMAESSLISDAVKKIDTDSAFKDRIKKNKIQPETLGYWDEIKRALGTMEESALKKSKTKANIIGDVRRDLVSNLDTLYPDYQRARALGQRDIIRNKLEGTFDKKDLTGFNFYKNILSSDKNFNKLIGDLSEFPHIQQQLHDMRKVFPRLLNTPTGRAAHGLESTSMTRTRGGLVQSAEELFNNLIGQRADVEAVKLMTDPNWLTKMIKQNETNQYNELLAKALESIGKSAGQTAGGHNEANK